MRALTEAELQALFTEEELPPTGETSREEYSREVYEGPTLQGLTPGRRPKLHGTA